MLWPGTITRVHSWKMSLVPSVWGSAGCPVPVSLSCSKKQCLEHDFSKKQSSLIPIYLEQAVLDKYIKTVTCFCLWCFQAWGLYPGSGTIMASPVTCQGDARGWCHRCAIGRESGTSSLCCVISALTWAQVRAGSSGAACREPLPSFSLHRDFWVQTKLDSATHDV